MMDEEEDGIGMLIDIGNNNPRPKKERRSFYDLPRGSEEDDTFGVLSRTSRPNSASADVNLMDADVNTGVLVDIESSQSSAEASAISDASHFSNPNTHSKLQSSYAAPSLTSSLASVSSLGHSVSSISYSRYFDNISRISKVDETSESSLMCDDVFSVDKSTVDRVPDWNMIMNEAQFLALSIQDKPSNTPVHKIASDHLLGNFSPCEGLDMLDSPSLDILQENPPDDLLDLVPLTPEKSPVKNLNMEMNCDQLVCETEIAVAVPSKARSINKPRLNKLTLKKGKELDENLEVFDDKPSEAEDMIKTSGDIPVSDNNSETPKKSSRRPSSGGKLSLKENINPSRPRQLLPKHPKFGAKKTNSPPPKEETEQKQNTNKIQKSNVMRTSMSNPGLPRRASGDKEETLARTSADKPDKPKAPLSSRRTPIKPLLPKGQLDSSANKLLIQTKSFQNVKSRINTGLSMPAVKGSLVRGCLTPASKTTGPNRMSSVKKVGSVVKPVMGSAIKGSDAGLMQAPRPALARQGSSLSRPSSATPGKGARQSLLFSTPGTKLLTGSQLSTLGSLPGRRSAVTAAVRSAVTPGGRPTAVTSRLAPSTPSSRLAAPSTPSSRLAAPSTTTTPRLAAPSITATPRTRMATPKARGSLRMSLPSPMVRGGNPSLVHSTPAIPNPRMISSGLPSPIGVKRRVH